MQEGKTRSRLKRDKKETKKGVGVFYSIYAI